MALNIMSALRPGRLASLLPLCLLISFLQLLSRGQVLRQDHSVFLRSKRSNSFLEEILQGNLERECFEEQCNFEEARECFENDEQTPIIPPSNHVANSFWTRYVDGNQCDPNPCLHGGNCTDKVGGFHCSCPTPHYGPICELETAAEIKEQSKNTVNKAVYRELVKCPTEGPTACQQQCTASQFTFTCSCTAGFRLHSDQRSCLPEVEFPCGQIPERSGTSSLMCHPGSCPWQVSLHNSEGGEPCGGVLLDGRTVLTAASCLHTARRYKIGPQRLSIVAGDQQHYPVQDLVIHNRFRPDRDDHDLALLLLAEPVIFSPILIPICLPTKDFSENILMNSGRTGVADRGRSRRNQELVYMTLDDCRSELEVSQSLSNKMFCMRKQAPNLHPPAVGRQIQQLPTAYHNDTYDRRSNQTTANENHGSQRNRAMTSKVGNQGTLVSGSVLRPDGGGRSCSGPLPGSPVATVEHGTAFLTGILMSTTAGCDGLVFTKLSRYLNWIRPRLEAAEGRTTPNSDI